MYGLYLHLLKIYSTTKSIHRSDTRFNTYVILFCDKTSLGPLIGGNIFIALYLLSQSFILFCLICLFFIMFIIANWMTAKHYGIISPNMWLNTNLMLATEKKLTEYIYVLIEFIFLRSCSTTWPKCLIKTGVSPIFKFIFLII